MVITMNNYFILLAIAVRKVEEPYLSTNKLFREWYYNNDSLKISGDIIKRPELGNALERIANNGINEFYNGSISDEIVNEVSTFKIVLW